MAAGMDPSALTKAIFAIQRDPNLSEAEKAKKRQELMSGKWAQPAAEQDEAAKPAGKGKGKEVAVADEPAATMFDDTLKCAMCMELAVRPVTAPCQHNFCLGCFTKWSAGGKKGCPTCRAPFPAKWAANPRINTALATAIRMAKLGAQPKAPTKAFERIHDKDRPDEAFTTDRAVRAGRANAASGRIMVTIPGDHFGPIPASADPRGLGIRVGEWWKDRLDCRQWGAHFPHVAGIAGQSSVGSQSVVLSGGYEDDRDEGEWFLYTGSGGRDLSGNKRVSKVQSFDQKFESMNKALLTSCQKGLPVRVVRSFKEKRSAYAPTDEQPVRYDGVYRIARAWRKPGAQGLLMCRYLFIRCDNEPAPWSSEDVGDGKWDGKLPTEAVKDMAGAKGTVYSMTDKPWWDWLADKGEWGWARSPPISQKQGGGGDDDSNPKKLRKKATEQEKALREFKCGLCTAVLGQPVSTPCGHHFCKPCLERKFEGVTDVAEAAHGRTMRVRHNQKPCPTCKADIAEFLRGAQVNRDMAEVIERLQAAARAAQAEAARLEAGGAAAGEDGAAAEGEDEDAAQEEQEDAETAEQEADEEEEATAGGSASAQPEPEPEKQAASPPAQPAKGSGQAAPTQQASPAAAAPAAAAAPSAPSMAGVGDATGEEIAAVCAEFAEFDSELVRGMVEDQGGDLPEVRAALRRMRNQLAAAERKAKAAAAKAEKAAGAKAEKAAAKAQGTAGGAGSSAGAQAAEPAEPAAAPPKAKRQKGGKAAVAASEPEREAEGSSAAAATEAGAVAEAAAEQAAAEEQRAGEGAAQEEVAEKKVADAAPAQAKPAGAKGKGVKRAAASGEGGSKSTTGSGKRSRK